MHRLGLMIAGFFLLPTVLQSAADAQTKAFHAELWFCGMDPAARLVKFPEDPPSGLLEMFTASAPWARTAAAVRVFKLPPSLVLGGRDGDLRQIFANLRQRRIALGVEFGWLYGPGKGRCGSGVEGFAAPHEALAMAQRIQKLGGDLQYVAMDEPLYYGHVYAGAHACQFAISEVAQRVAVGAAEVKSVFPQVRIGDIEPVGSTDASWPATIKAWNLAFHAATGARLAFFHSDVQWTGPWQQQLPLVARVVRADGVPFGIIYDGTGNTDALWERTAAYRFRQLEADPATRPDQAIIQSWDEHPLQMMPERTPGTLTNLALLYLQSR